MSQTLAAHPPSATLDEDAWSDLLDYLVGHANFSSPPEAQDYDATCYAATEMVEQARDVVGRFGRARAVLRGRCVCLSNMLSVERTVLRLKHGT